MQRQSITPSPSRSQEAVPGAPRQPAQATPNAPAAQPGRSWMGPLAGLAAGLGLAALASHFGFGEGLANVMLIGLLIMGAVMLFGFLSRKKAPPRSNGLQYAGAGNAYSAPAAFSPAAGVSGASSAASIPAGFDVDAFVRNAKVNFIRLQAANDAGNLEDIREFTMPEMFGEIKMEMDERGNTKQQTDVVQLNAEVIDVTEEASRYIVSVRFNGQIREEKDAAAAPFDEIWHMTKPRDGSRGWTLAGIQQVQ